MAFTGTQAMTRAAALLNDAALGTYNTTNLLPHIQNAMLRLQSEFNLNDLPVTSEESAVLAIGAGNNLTAASVPPIPTDLIHPYDMWEKPTGSTIDNYVPMLQVKELPNRLADTTLNEWQWRDGEIYFVGATIAVDVKLTYEKTLLVIAAAGTSITLLDIELYLAAQTAAFAALIMGGNSELAAANQAMADSEIKNIIANRVKEGQNLAVRRKTYGHYRRVRRVR
ncbi:MAG: hypothetical protein KAJ19_27515 [Gammaproteobacteria bacterium]|nr:hypothetical protein [Gammaproteobacteria bacterium]